MLGMPGNQGKTVGRCCTIVGSLVLVCSIGTAHAGWLDKAVGDALKGAGRRGVSESVDGVYDGTKDALAGKDKPASKPEASGSQEEDPGSGGEATPASGTQSSSPSANTTSQASGNPSAPASGAQSSSPGSATVGAAGGDIASAEVAYARYDFVPGDKVIFWDDFSDTDQGDFPRKWTLKCGEGGSSGYGGGQTVEIVESQARRFLAVQPSGGPNDTQREAGLCVRWNKKTEMPEKFTVEFDVLLGLGGPQNDWTWSASEYVLHLGESLISISADEVRTANTKIEVSRHDGKLYHVAIGVNENTAKVYINNERMANDPDGIERPIGNIGMELKSGGHYHKRIMFTNFRIAEGGKDIKSALETDGRIVTHGILFDSGSDRLKPESLPTLKKILALLEGDPGLKFSIEGHTDSQGKQEINQPLSERRAAAVKAWMEGKGIAAERLQARGWGDEKPIDANDSAEGRANNRRVEFVKI